MHHAHSHCFILFRMRWFLPLLVLTFMSASTDGKGCRFHKSKHAIIWSSQKRISVMKGYFSVKSFWDDALFHFGLGSVTKHRSISIWIRKRIFQIILLPHTPSLRESSQSLGQESRARNWSRGQGKCNRTAEFSFCGSHRDHAGRDFDAATTGGIWQEKHMTALLLEWFFVEKVPSQLPFL